jgi:hypothetical protein
MQDTFDDKWVKQSALLAALLCVGLSLSNGVTLTTCGARFAVVYCIAILIGRLGCQMWQWSASSSSPRASLRYKASASSESAPDKAAQSTEAPNKQGG